MKVALYKRVSTLNQFEKGYSLDAQDERLKAYCKAKDYEIIMNIDDPGYSGSDLERPGMVRIIEAVQHKVVDAVIVYKLDRLSRSQKDVLFLIEDVFLPSGVDFISISENFDTTTPSGRAMIGLLSVFAQLERDAITERFMSGRQQRARIGKWHGGGTEVIGYDYVDGELVVNEDESYQVKLVYDMYAAGASLTYILDHMKQQGYETKHGPWSYISTITNVLENPLYAGYIHFDGIIVPGGHKAIISQELNNKVKAMRERAKRMSYKQNNSKHLLTGLVYCAKCGARYFVKKDREKYYYCCHSRAKSNKAMVKDPNCKNDNWRSIELEEKVVQELLKAATSGVKQQVIPNFQDSILKRIEGIDSDIKQATALYNDETQSIEDVAAKINQLTIEKAKLLNQIKIPVPKGQQSELLRDLPHAWNMYDIAQKRKVLAQLVNRIIIDGQEVYMEFA